MAYNVEKPWFAEASRNAVEFIGRRFFYSER